jgi:hypothetical protein
MSPRRGVLTGLLAERVLLCRIALIANSDEIIQILGQFPMQRLLVSVRGPNEAVAAAKGGAHIADVEFPGSALGTPYPLNINPNYSRGGK